MTDARFPDRWLSDRRIARLPDSHFRSFVTSLVWSVTNRTDGVIEPDDLALVPNFAKESVKAFVGAGLWEPRQGAGRGWQIVDFEVTQTTSAQLQQCEQNRVKERERKARYRAKTAARGHVPRDRDGDVPQDSAGQDRTGKDRQGQARTGQDRPGLGESKISEGVAHSPEFQRRIDENVRRGYES